jgi:hypothetical protein
MDNTLSNLAAALSAAQGEMEKARKDSTNPHFRSKYADLASCWDACREPLTRNGLSVIQMPLESEPGTVRLRTILMHKSGESIESVMSIPATKNDAQGYGSAITYARRYALCATVGISPEDDDAEGAINRKQPAQQAQVNPHTVEAINSIDTVADLQSAYKAMSASDRMLYAQAFKARKTQIEAA